MNWQDRITVDPDILVGKPIIKGTRIAVELILDRTADGWSLDDIQAAYPHLHRDDILAALRATQNAGEEPAQLDIETFEKIGDILENQALYELMRACEDDEELGLEEAKASINRRF